MLQTFVQSQITPRHMQEASKLLGVKEIPGPKSNKQILSWAKTLGLEKIYTNDDMSWCAIATLICLHKANRKVVFDTKDQYDYLRARSFLNYDGVVVKAGEEAYGDILIFKRSGGFHVGFYVAESGTTFYVIGGNQSNTFSIVEIAKSRLAGARRPKYINFLPKKYHVNSSGVLSINEA